MFQLSSDFYRYFELNFKQHKMYITDAVTASKEVKEIQFRDIIDVQQYQN